MDERPTFGSLFSGIGGIDLGLERVGWRCEWQCEIDPFCRAVLRKHWPDVPCYEDIRAMGGAVPHVDLIAGGFPCQPVSLAGKRRAQDDARWLWPEFGRLIRLLRPRFALMENVPGLLSAGMGDVLGELAACGYDAEWDCIPAAAVGAPHRRDRVWIVAYPHTSELRIQPAGQPGGSRAAVFGDDGAQEPMANSDSARPQRHGRPFAGAGQFLAPARGPRAGAGADGVCDTDRLGSEGLDLSGQQGETGSPSRRWWAVEPDVGRVANGVPMRVDRLRSLGNAVVPQVAEWIGRRLMELI